MSELDKITPVAPKARRTATAAPKAEAFEAFSMSNVEFPEAFREAAEKTVKQAKEGYDKIRAAAEEATDLFEDQVEAARTNFTAIGTKALDAAKANADATFKFAKDLMTVKTFAEAIELQSAFARYQFDQVTAQSKDMQELVTKIVTESSQPVKEAVSKFMKDAKAA